MSRPIELDRRQAENIIDLIEVYAEEDQEMMQLALELREQWGMGPQNFAGRAASEGPPAGWDVVAKRFIP